MHNHMKFTFVLLYAKTIYKTIYKKNIYIYVYMYIFITQSFVFCIGINFPPYLILKV